MVLWWIQANIPPIPNIPDKIPRAEIKAQGGSNSASCMVDPKFRIPAKDDNDVKGISIQAKIQMNRLSDSDLVGTAGFEPATPCTPCKCATRLRHAPSAAKYTAS